MLGSLLPPAGGAEGPQPRGEHVHHVTEEVAVVEGEPEENDDEEETKKDEEDDLTMPKAMISASLQRQKNEPWGFVIVGGKDQALTVKLGRIKP